MIKTYDDGRVEIEINGVSIMVTPIKKAAAPAVARKYVRKSRRKEQFPRSLYTDLRAMPVGGKKDITNIMNRAGTGYTSAKQRLYSFQWAENNRRHNPIKLELERDGSAVFVSRAA